jgi:predicted secreted protein
MTALAKTTFGAVLRLAVSGGSLATVAELTEIPGPSFSRSAVDVTSHDSLGQAMEFMADGVFDPGELALTGHLIMGSTSDTLLTTAISTGNVHDFEITAKAASGTRKWTGKGIITAYEVSAFGVTGKQEFSATIKVTGPITQSA